VNTSKVQARKMVLVSAFLLAVIAVYRDRKSGAGDTFHALWGVGVLSWLLSLAADFAPTVAGPFAVLTVLGSMTNGGDQLIQKALGKVSAGTTSGGTTSSGSTNPPRPATPAGTVPRGGTR
jgi:hypothetical protein